ncbi:DeoR/GlpR family DNA-binding transcription regulator [Opitutus terrae]|uniref:Transcriptional regulator, DeoR family n=1 Tax=Opitutus terrae (strain DSM 11246 / JCM 15787 / PB90-1) TaxID=452637 RepID=B1ZR86_OPITP|nr:DeoR/GlpR family DNA-binding transcription regulator [Opitutus terrae]ACB74573.1 transcriptional regulator, DeoR family [Opitutus terrae PB90-1]
MRVPLHIVEKRREQLRQLIRTDGFLPIAEICRRLEVSEATARRDLVAVAASGHITRTRGGALADYNTTFASHGQRAHRARTAKTRIAAAALARIPASGTVFLDAGTTVQAIARLLLGRQPFTKLTVVTNSLPLATILGGAPGLELHVLGGMFLHRQAILLGPQSTRTLTAWKFDAAFLGGEGMDAQGVTNSHANIAAFQQAVLRRAAKAYFCLDATKLGRATPHRVVGWDRSIHLITDATPAALARASIALPLTHYIPAK